MKWHFLAFRDNLFTATQLLMLLSSAFMLAAIKFVTYGVHFNYINNA